VLGVVAALHPTPRLESEDRVLPKEDIESRLDEGVAEAELGDRLGGETAPGMAIATPGVGPA